jgi:hypothetical protein
MFVGLGGSAILAQLAGRYVAQKRTKDWFFRVNVVVHLVISPLMVPLIATSPRLLAMALGEPLLHVQTSAPLTGRTAVLINPTYTFSGTYLSLVRQYHGLDFPQGVKSLVPGIYGVALKRIDEHSLEVRPVGGVLADLFARLWRSNQETFEVGMHVRMADWDVEVLELDYQGWPTAIRVSFDRPLDDPELVFLAQDHQTLVETRLPPVGETLTLPAWTP